MIAESLLTGLLSMGNPMPGAVISAPEILAPIEERVEAVRKAPADPRARLELGMAYAEAEEYEFALSELVEAIRLNPENRDNLSARANFELGNVLFAIDRIVLAADAYREALRLGWETPEVHIALAQALSGQGKLEEAVAQYREALTLSPEAFEAHVGLALALESLGRVEEAAGHYERSLQSVGARPQADDHGIVAIKQRLARLKERQKM